MNKQEVIDKIESKKVLDNFITNYGVGYNKALDDTIDIINQLDEPERPPEPKPLEIEKPVVPQVAVEFYERYKDDNLALGEWFDDFYSPEAIEEFPRMDELTEWLYGNNDEINRQREFALATLATLGIDAVEVEKEKLYTVEIPNPNAGGHVVLCKTSDGIVSIAFTGMARWQGCKNFQLAEAEIKKDFDWALQFKKEVK